MPGTHTAHFGTHPARTPSISQLCTLVHQRFIQSVVGGVGGACGVRNTGGGVVLGRWQRSSYSRESAGEGSGTADVH